MAFRRRPPPPSASSRALKAAVDTVITTLQMGVPVARIELLDEVQMAACITYSKLEGMTASPTLFLEFHGTEASVKRAGRDGGGHRHRMPAAPGFAWATDAEARNKPVEGAARRLLGRRGQQARQPAASPPMSVCQSRTWPRRCWGRRRISRPPASPPPWSAMSATAISTPSSCWKTTARPRWNAAWELDKKIVASCPGTRRHMLGRAWRGPGQAGIPGDRSMACRGAGRHAQREAGTGPARASSTPEKSFAIDARIRCAAGEAGGVESVAHHARIDAAQAKP